MRRHTCFFLLKQLDLCGGRALSLLCLPAGGVQLERLIIVAIRSEREAGVEQAKTKADVSCVTDTLISVDYWCAGAAYVASGGSDSEIVCGTAFHLSRSLALA